MQAISRASSPRYRLVSNEKASGATYTPKILADFVAEHIVAIAELHRGKTPIRILDPAIGDGALLVSLLAKLRERTDIPIAIYGFDTDTDALSEARHRIHASALSAEVHLKHGNFLEFVAHQADNESPPSLFAREGAQKFNLIIANPPYVRTQIMGAELAQQLAAKFSLRGRVDLYHAFLIGMAHVLEPDGVAGIIVSNRFMTTKGGASVRSMLREKLRLRQVWDLGDTKLFNAAVLPAVILAQGRPRMPGKSTHGTAFSSIYETKEVATATAADPIAALAHNGTVELPDGRRLRVQHGTLNDTDNQSALWCISTNTSDTWLATVKSKSWGTFRDIGKVRVGVKTCADKVFIRSDWDTFPETQRPELLRSLATHHIASRFKATPQQKHQAILYPHETLQGQRRPVDLMHYPKTRRYLEEHRAVLEERTYVMEAGRRWYELWVPQDPEAWSKPKLVFRDISERPTFWLDLDGDIVNGDCYWLSGENLNSEALLWLAAAVANSTFCEAFYDHRFNNKLYSGRRRFITQYVEQFPLPDPTTPLALDIVKTTQAIYAAARTPAVIRLEEELDRMVWESFGLPIEEVVR
jgi:adenine-specific DNA-methyltransferase